MNNRNFGNGKEHKHYDYLRFNYFTSPKHVAGMFFSNTATNAKSRGTQSFPLKIYHTYSPIKIKLRKLKVSHRLNNHHLPISS